MSWALVLDPRSPDASPLIIHPSVSGLDEAGLIVTQVEHAMAAWQERDYDPEWLRERPIVTYATRAAVLRLYEGCEIEAHNRVTDEVHHLVGDNEWERVR